MKYIRVYDNVFDDSTCDHIVNVFEENPDQQERVIFKDTKDFSVLKLPHHPDTWEDLQNILLARIFEQIKIYVKDTNIDVEVQWPKSIRVEGLRIKKYCHKSEQQFREHVDVRARHARDRFLAFIVYLNDNEKGFTIFPDHNVSVQPQKGRTLFFPPYWNYKHAAVPPIGNPKYIVSAFLLL